MIHVLPVTLVSLMFIVGCTPGLPKQSAALACTAEYINLGKWTEGDFDGFIREASTIRDVARRIEFISHGFLDTSYEANTLIGDKDNPEILVVNEGAVDCFTFIDYVEAIRRSKCFTEFKEALKLTRYASGVVDYRTRNHFFSDWREFNGEYIQDVTEKVGPTKAKTAVKFLNLKEDGTNLVPGLPVRERIIYYIPADAIDESVTANLRTGDYVGIYSQQPGLDVSHVGIVIKQGNRISLRHATSRQNLRKVIDSDFLAYMKKTPGLVVFRARDTSPECPPRCAPAGPVSEGLPITDR